ncbi:MAG: DMT family transporter [Pyrinomonadaceae bacterium]
MIKVVLYTALALVAFALNSILCRLALRGDEADAVGFTGVRLASGAITLITLSYFLTKRNTGSKRGSWFSAFFLFAYAVCFSFAYLGLTAATGALILFGSVQISMIGIAILRGERPSPFEWLGLAVALSGLIYLVYPGLSAPPLVSSVLMAAAGMSWAGYTLRGRGSSDPLADTTGNFVRSLPMIAAVALAFIPNLHLSERGIVLAALSGAFASGVGYTVWYTALKFHTSTRAAILQLAVPVIAAAGGVLLLDESASVRLGLAGALILGGIALTLIRKQKAIRPRVGSPLLSVDV